jgi:manganese/zinc/iron transport system permease protein
MESSQYYNPYSGQTFAGFFVQLFIRLWSFIRGNMSLDDLVSDEIQILVLIGVASSAALVGSFLILRKMTMLANSLSHTILIGIVMAYFLFQHGVLGGTHFYAEPIPIQAMLIAALIMGLVTAFLTEFLTKGARLQEDASTGIVFTSLFAVGIILVTVLTRSAHIGTEVVMGNVDALHIDDCKLTFIILGINSVLFLLFFKEFKITTFDPGLARAFGISTVFFNYLLMSQVSATAIGAFRAVGVLMVLAFITGPALIARLLTHDLKKMLLLAVLIGCTFSVVGVAISRHLLTVHGLALSTAGIVVCTIVFTYALAIFTQFLRVRKIM